MVICRQCAFWIVPVVAQHADEPLLKQLDPPRRAAVLMALLGLVLIGVTLVACVMIGGRWARRMARHRPGRNRTHPTGDDKTWRKQLAQHLPDVDPGETTVIDQTTDETKAD
jgi:hypothetical protein